jgi:dihydrofolate reductase
MPQLLRVQNFTISSDGFGSGEGQSLEHPFGHADVTKLMEWFFPTTTFARNAGTAEASGSKGVDDYFARDYHHNIGAEIMGRNKFGPQRGPWENEDWQGWWGDVPPFHTPVFVMTHYPRPSITLADTTFHFLDTTPDDALAQAKAAADGKDVRLGGGVGVVREFLDAGLIDTLHIVVAPIELGRGERLWSGPDDLVDRYHHESVASPSGVTHHLFWRS